MSTTAHSTPGVVDADSANAANKSRIVVCDKLKDNAKGAVKTTVELLGVAAQMTQSVPYLGAISTVLTEFMKIQDEVDQCKDECKEAMDDSEQINALIKRFRDGCVASGRGESALNETLCQAFAELERIVLECVTTLQKCKMDSKRKRDRLRVYWKRSDLLKSVKGCATKMRKAVDRFDRTLNVDAAFMLESIDVKVDEIRAMLQLPSAPQGTANDLSSAWRRRGAPIIFYGRESEVDHAVSLIVNQAPARVAILGSGGIGKTSIALAVLHHPEVEVLYGNRRCFVSCEAATSVDGVVRALATALNFAIPSVSSAESSQYELFDYLKTVTGIICLDNLETPWDADTAAIEDFLAEFAHLPSVALIITSRVTDIPLIGWSEPQLAHIMPFTLKAALQTWDTICGGHDEYSVRLVEAVDCVPLAVTLLARLGRTETAKTMWARWETERTELIRSHGAEHRLNNLGISIELSLKALKSREAIDALVIICMFSTELYDMHLCELDNAGTDSLSVRRAVTTLKQSSLVYSEAAWDDTEIMIGVLSPIRHHMQQHHVTDELFLMLTDIMMQNRQAWYWHPILKFGFNRKGPCRERCLNIVISDPTSTTDIEVLSQAIDRSRELEPSSQAKLHLQLGRALGYVGDFPKSRCSIRRAIELDEQLGHRQGLFESWVEWICTFQCEFSGHEDECQYLDEVQNVIGKLWDLGRDESGAWDRGCVFGYGDVMLAQHFVNRGRRKLHMPVVHRSAVYMDNDSTISLDCHSWAAACDQLVLTSPPPWDLSLIVETMKLVSPV